MQRASTIPRMRLILASASPRRRDLLAAAGIAHVVDPVDADERRMPDEPPAAYVERVALAKARCRAGASSGDAVLGADTIVVVDGDVLGKPADDADAVAMLTRLSGRAHDVLTGVALAWPRPRAVASGDDARCGSRPLIG